MAEYIERQKVLDFAKTFSIDICSDEEYFLAFAYVDTNDIKSIPAADVRPVVMCCDCKHFQVNVSPSGYLPQGVPEWECRYRCRPTDPTDFCSYGEKREES